MQPQSNLTKAILIWVPPHHDQFYRPYETHLNGATLRKLEIATDQGMHLRASNMADIASSIITPSSTPMGKVIISNGFQESRLAFFLEITSGEVFGCKQREIITGFTSHYGVDRNGNIDPQMIFYVNSRMVIADDIIGYGPNNHKQPVTAVHSNSQVLARTGIQGTTSLRPEDVIGYSQNNQLLGMEYEVFDNRWNLGVKSHASERSNAIPAHYLSKIVDGMVKADYATRVVDQTEDMYTEALGNVKTQSLEYSNFVSQMGMIDPTRTHCFSFAEINSRWFRPNDFWIKTLPRPGARMTSPLENTEHWNGAIVETGLAYSLSHALPALMSKLMLLEIEMDITNQTTDGLPAVAIIHHAGMFENTITPQKIEYFVNQIHIDLIRGIILSKVGIFHIKMNVNLLSNSHFNISVNGQPAIPYSAPMFCESYYSPLIGMQKDLSQLSGTMEQIVTNISVARNNDQPLFNANQHIDYVTAQQQMFGDIVQHSIPKPPPAPRQQIITSASAVPVAPRRTV